MYVFVVYAKVTRFPNENLQTVKVQWKFLGHFISFICCVLLVVTVRRRQRSNAYENVIASQLERHF